VGRASTASGLFMLAGGVLPARSLLLAYWVNRISVATVMGPAVPGTSFVIKLARDRDEADLGCRRSGVS
jgi:hypothetical protein